VRLPRTPDFVLRFLNAGAQGIHVPRCSTADDLEGGGAVDALSSARQSAPSTTADAPETTPWACPTPPSGPTRPTRSFWSSP
jgi:hypothetical protein